MKNVDIVFGRKPTKIDISTRLRLKGIPFGTNILLYIGAILERIGLIILSPIVDPLLSEDERFNKLQEIISRLYKAGTLESVTEVLVPPDEPHIFLYTSKILSNKTASGSSFTSRLNACYAAVAEALERHIWNTDLECIEPARIASYTSLAHRAIDPLRFAGFSSKQRSENPTLYIDGDTPLGWIKAWSHVQNKSVFVPAQLVTARHFEDARHNRKEPIVRMGVTTGLSTASSKAEAVSKAALECIERDAFMIQYMNKFTPPQLDLESLATKDSEIEALLTLLKRYRLTAKILYLTVDAPAHVVCCVLNDESGVGPSLVPGMRASFNLKTAIMDAIKESLAIRIALRINPPKEIPAHFGDFVHRDRGAYWAKKENAHQLDFFLAGEYTEKNLDETPQGYMSADLNWSRQLDLLTAWFKSKKYEFVSVDLSNSKYNVTNWHITLALCPELQPLHLIEKYPYLGGTRYEEIATKLGKSSPVELNSIPQPFM